MGANELAAVLERHEMTGGLYLFSHTHAWYKVGTGHKGQTVVACTLCPDICSDSDWPRCEATDEGHRCELPAIDHRADIHAAGAHAWPVTA